MRGNQWPFGRTQSLSTARMAFPGILIIELMSAIHNFTSTMLEWILGLIPPTIHPPDITPLPFIPQDIYPLGLLPPMPFTSWTITPLGFLPSIPFTPRTITHLGLLPPGKFTPNIHISIHACLNHTDQFLF